MPIKNATILSETKLAIATKKEKKISAGKGLTLVISPVGNKSWRYRFEFLGKEQTLTFGKYPEMTELDAIGLLVKARTDLAKGLNPAAVKRQVKKERYTEATNTLELFAKRYFFVQEDVEISGGLEKQVASGLITKKTFNSKCQRMEKWVYPILGDIPVAQITSHMLLGCITAIKDKKSDSMAGKCLSIMKEILAQAVFWKLIDRNVAFDLMGILKLNLKGGHHPRTTNPVLVGKILREIDSHHFDNHFNDPITRLASQFLPYVFVRVKTLTTMTWDQVNFETATWTIPAKFMKVKTRELVVPLSRQALAILLEVKKYNGNMTHVFTKTYSLPEIVVLDVKDPNDMLKRMGYFGIQSAHGWRSTSYTTLEEAGWDSKYIKAQHSHLLKDKTEGVYNGAAWMAVRREMMQWYADQLDKFRAGAEIIQLKSA